MTVSFCTIGPSPDINRSPSDLITVPWLPKLHCNQFYGHLSTAGILAKKFVNNNLSHLKYCDKCLDIILTSLDVSSQTAVVHSSSERQIPFQDRALDHCKTAQDQLIHFQVNKPGPT